MGLASHILVKKLKYGLYGDSRCGEKDDAGTVNRIGWNPGKPSYKYYYFI